MGRQLQALLENRILVREKQDQPNHAALQNCEPIFTLAYDHARHSYILIHNDDDGQTQEPIDEKTAVALLAMIKQAKEPAKDPSPLNPREIQVLQAVAEGLTNQAIACRLHITENTAKRHLQSIFLKLNVSSRTQAVVLALFKGWVSIDQLARDR